MKTSTLRAIYWTPRVLGLLFAGFITLFALDAFDGQHYGISEMLTDFLTHLIPTGICLALLALAWRWDWAGISFGGLGIIYLVAAWGRFHWSAYAVISGPLLLLAALFLISGIVRAKSTLESRTA